MAGSVRHLKKQAGLLLAAVIVCTAATGVEVPGATGAFVDDALSELGFDPAQKDDLEAGKIISVGLPNIERQANELAVGAAMMLVRRPLPAVTEALLDDRTFRINTDILDFRPLGDGSASREQVTAIFADVGYTEAESAEVTDLLRARPGSRFNFSSDEIERFRAVEESGDRARVQVSGIMADLLEQRFIAYLQGGLAAVEPYARSGRKQASPRDELETAFTSLKLLQQYFPAFFGSLSGFPAKLPADTVDRFYWTKRIASDRPSFVLSHRMQESKPDYTIAMELQFYAQRSYNSMLTLLACVPTEQGTLVITAVRVFTDQITGIGSSMKRGIGRKQVVESMNEYFDEVRQELERQPANSG